MSEVQLRRRLGYIILGIASLSGMASILLVILLFQGHTLFYAKGESVVQQGCLCRYVGIVKSGYFKYVALNSKGDEVVTGFSFEYDVVTDYVRGFLFNQTSLASIVAGCNAEILQVSVEEVRRFLMERHPGFFADASSNLLQEAYRRYLDMLVKTPTERFQELSTRYPGVIKNLPLQEIASYLGISRRQLHRIRETESSFTSKMVDI